MTRNIARAILLTSFSVVLVGALSGCAAMRNRFGGGDEYSYGDEYGYGGAESYGDGACGPDGCSVEPGGYAGHTPATGSDVFGGNMSSPAKGSSFGSGLGGSSFGGSGTR